MEDTLVDAQKDEKLKADSTFRKEIKLLEEDHLLLSNSKSNTLTRRSNPLQTLHFNAMQHRISKHCAKNSIFPSSFRSLDDQIPKSLVSIDDKYIQQCLESIHHSASRSSAKVSILSDILNLSKSRIGMSHLLHQFPDFKNSSGESPSSTGKFSSEYVESRDSTWGNHKYESDSVNETVVSSSSSFYPSSPLSSSNSASLYRGMLQCRWKERVPHFVFSSNDLKEIYTAKLWKVKSDSEGDKGSDYVYLFQSGKNSQTFDECGVEETPLVGKMTVSTSSSHCSNDSQIAETEFVLYGGIGTSEMEIHTPNDNLRRKKRLSRKMVDVFRSNHLSKQRSASRFSGQISGEDYCLWEPYARKDERFHLLDNDLPSNFQLAAIVVKQHLPANQQDKAGGWGLKFLRKVEKKQTNKLLECCGRNGGECSTSTHILVPPGLHGGPRTRNTGLTTLTERWRFGGRCDCGGWDLGCPLTTYKVGSSEEEASDHAQIVVQGSDHGGPPTLRMVNIRDDLYLIHFRPNLSVLQSFSIAVAIIHSRNPVLKPENRGSLK